MGDRARGRRPSSITTTTGDRHAARAPQSGARFRPMPTRKPIRRWTSPSTWSMARKVATPQRSRSPKRPARASPMSSSLAARTRSRRSRPIRSTIRWLSIASCRRRSSMASAPRSSAAPSTARSTALATTPVRPSSGTTSRNSPPGDTRCPRPSTSSRRSAPSSPRSIPATISARSTAATASTPSSDRAAARSSIRRARSTSRSIPPIPNARASAM